MLAARQKLDMSTVFVAWSFKTCPSISLGISYFLFVAYSRQKRFPCQAIMPMH